MAGYFGNGNTLRVTACRLTKMPKIEAEIQRQMNLPDVSDDLIRRIESLESQVKILIAKINKTPAAKEKQKR